MHRCGHFRETGENTQAIRGIYDGKTIRPHEPIQAHPDDRVIITFIEPEPVKGLATSRLEMWPTACMQIVRLSTCGSRLLNRTLAVVPQSSRTDCGAVCLTSVKDGVQVCLRAKSRQELMTAEPRLPKRIEGVKNESVKLSKT